jgi:hypothetical protein
MKPTEIISAEFQKMGQDPTRMLKALSVSVKNKLSLIFQENDTVMVLRLIEPQKAEMSLASVDGDLKLAKSLRKFLEKIQGSNIKFVYGSDEDKKSLSIMKSVGWPLQKSDNPKYEWMARI